MKFCKWFLQLKLKLILFLYFSPANRQKFYLHFIFLDPAQQKQLVFSYWSMSDKKLF